MIRLRALFATLAALAVTACAGLQPQPSNREIADACLLLQQNRPWQEALRETARNWGAPMGFQLAVMKQESSFDAEARPPRGEAQWYSRGQPFRKRAMKNPSMPPRAAQ